MILLSRLMFDLCGNSGRRHGNQSKQYGVLFVWEDQSADTALNLHVATNRVGQYFNINHPSMIFSIFTSTQRVLFLHREYSFYIRTPSLLPKSVLQKFWLAKLVSGTGTVAKTKVCNWISKNQLLLKPTIEIHRFIPIHIRCYCWHTCSMTLCSVYYSKTSQCNSGNNPNPLCCNNRSVATVLPNPSYKCAG